MSLKIYISGIKFLAIFFLIYKVSNPFEISKWNSVKFSLELTWIVILIANIASDVSQRNDFCASIKSETDHML